MLSARCMVASTQRSCALKCSTSASLRASLQQGLFRARWKVVSLSSSHQRFLFTKTHFSHLQNTLYLHNIRRMTATSTKPAPSTWRRIASWIRYTRIPILVVSVYSLGYQQGVMECTKTPQALQQQILQTILMSVGVHHEQQVHVLSENDISFYSRSKHHQVAAVGHKIICSARQYVQEEVVKAMAVVKQKLPPDITESEALEYYQADETVQFWHHARLRLFGEELQTKPWQYIFMDSPHPNAFVTEILPQRFFITTAMLEVAETPDELGVVLGHEVSHLVLGHVSQTNQVEMALRTLEVLLLSLDPTSGFLAIGVIAGLAAMRKALSAAYSRENEYQADELGLQLAARACFDTVKGSRVMYKMHQHKVSDAPPSTNSSIVRVMDTHPPTLERYRILQDQAVQENYPKYDDCQSVSSRFFAALWGSSSSAQQDAEDSKS